MPRLVGAWLIVGVAATVASAGSPESRYTRALAAYGSGEYAAATVLLDEVLSEEPEHAGALYYRGLVKAKTGDYEAAVADLEAAGLQDPELPVAANLGVIYFEAGHREEAKKWLQQVGEEAPAAGRAQLLLGVIAAEEEAFAAAEAHFAAAERLDSALTGIVSYQRGVMADRQGRAKEARAALGAAAEWGAGPVADAATAYLESMEGGAAPVACRPPRRLSLYARGGFEYDSNLLLQNDPADPTSTAAPASPGLVETRKGDGRFIVGAGATYDVLDTDMARLNLGYDFYQSLHFRLSEFNLQGHTVRATLDLLDGPIVPGIETAYRFYLLEDRTYFHELEGSPFVLLDEKGQGQFEIYYRARGRDYLGKPFNPARDAVNHAAGARQTFFLGNPRDTLYVWYQFDRENPESNKSGRDFDARSHQIEVGVSWSFPGIADVQAAYGYRNEEYLKPNSRGFTFSASVLPDGRRVSRESRLKRRDDAHWFSVFATRRLSALVYAQVGYVGRLNDSNIGVYDYDRHIITATVGVDF